MSNYTDEIRKPIEPELDGKLKNTEVDLAKQLITQIRLFAKLATATLQPATC